jgi:thiol-disulfide isomerase/thioredoxin
LPSLSLTFAALGLILINGGCDRQSQPPVQPRASEQADTGSAAPSPGSPDRSHAGSRLPDFTFSDPSGAKLRTTELQGTPTLINLWATWCAPCVKEMPLLDQMASGMKGQLRVVTISQDMQGKDKVEPFFKKNGYANLEPWLDPDNDLAFHYGGANLPMSVLYNAEGREVWRIAGDLDWSGGEARKLVAEALTK